MDIIDIMLAKAMTPQGKTDAYVAKANAAAAKAEKAQQDAAAAIATVESAAESIALTQEQIASLLEEAQETLETAQAAQINTLDTEDVDAEVKKLTVNTNVVSGNAANTLQVITTYPDNTLNTQNITKLYKATGNNEDGGMTQKAITDALTSKADITYVDQQIANIPTSGGNTSGGGISNFGSENEGRMVVVGEDGNIKAGDLMEEELIESLVQAGLYRAREAVGLDIDYRGKSFTRTQEAANLSEGQDFDQYIMYGGRTRCNVSDDGTITAFYGDSNYKEDGSNGQVMVYQPKFYYQRVPTLINGKTIYSESLILSSRKQANFKLHPIFSDGNGGELDYVLFSAYDGTLVDNKLSSVAGLQPATSITIEEAETYARARGTGWHIISMAAESANQMLQIVEYGTMNGQSALEAGISNLPHITLNINCSAITGSTAALGNTTGHAEMTVNNNNGVEVQNTEAGARAISYRGLENPWGNLWNFIGGINIKGDGSSDGGAPYICTDFNYTPSTIGSNYEYIGFNLPNTYGWISAMGYGKADYDWVFMPIECSNTANSLLPVGDNLWTVARVNENKIVVIGGAYTFQDNNGLFYYGCDSNANIRASNYGSRLMYIPTKNSIYTSNIAKWNNAIGG